MGKLVLTNVRAFAGAVDLTGVTNKATIDPKVEVKETTNFGDAGWKSRMAGLAETDFEVGGFFDAGTNLLSDEDPGLFAGLGAVGPWSFMPDGAADSALAWVTNALQAKYKLGGQVGDVAPFEASGNGSSRLARGLVGHVPGTARTASGTGTANQIGALTAAQGLYVNLHVLSVSGTTPSLTVRVESDNAVGFPSAVTVGTFTAATAVGGQHMRIAGPITDDWFRVAWTISGTTPSFLFLVTFGRA